MIYDFRFTALDFLDVKRLLSGVEASIVNRQSSI
jgi:hypothetical protein